MVRRPRDWVRLLKGSPPGGHPMLYPQPPFEGLDDLPLSAPARMRSELFQQARCLCDQGTLESELWLERVLNWHSYANQLGKERREYSKVPGQRHHSLLAALDSYAHDAAPQHLSNPDQTTWQTWYGLLTHAVMANSSDPWRQNLSYPSAWKAARTTLEPATSEASKPQLQRMNIQRTPQHRSAPSCAAFYSAERKAAPLRTRCPLLPHAPNTLRSSPARPSADPPNTYSRRLTHPPLC